MVDVTLFTKPNAIDWLLKLKYNSHLYQQATTAQRWMAIWLLLAFIVSCDGFPHFRTSPDECTYVYQLMSFLTCNIFFCSRVLHWIELLLVAPATIIVKQARVVHVPTYPYIWVWDVLSSDANESNSTCTKFSLNYIWQRVQVSSLQFRTLEIPSFGALAVYRRYHCDVDF